MKKILTPIFCLLANLVFAQDDLLSSLEKETKEPTTYTIATFKGTRLINGHSVETLKKKHMDYLISHRFGEFGDRFFYNFIGFDNANIRMAIEYGLTDNFTVGIGRNSVGKTYDYYGKYKLLKQSTGETSFPVTITAFGSAATTTVDTSPSTVFNNNLDRQSFTGQLLIARKFDENLSLQIMPTFVHRNSVEAGDENNTMAVGVGGRYKLSKRISFNAEYYYVVRNINYAALGMTPRYNAASFGFDIETGGHVFQLHFTNTRTMIEKSFIPETLGAGDTGLQNFHFGFNISRVFSFDKRAKGTNK